MIEKRFVFVISLVLGVAVVLAGCSSVFGGHEPSASTTTATHPRTAVSDSPPHADDGRTLVGIQGRGEPGAVALFDPNGQRRWRFDNASEFFEATLLPNGNVLSAFTQKVRSRDACHPFSPPCGRTGFRIIDPTTTHVVHQWSFPVRGVFSSEVHDVQRLPNGQFLLTDMEHERIMTVTRNGRITWQWNASRFYDAPPDPTRLDWLHINDVDRVGPGRYMVSVRNANQILFITRGKGVTGVVNADRNDSNDGNCGAPGRLADYHNDSGGDIRCGDPTLFKEQHNPQYLDSGAVLVADSRNNRVVELHRQNGRWRIAWKISSANGTSFDWPRDADRLPNGNTLITDSSNDRVVEVTESKRTVWSVHVPTWPYEADRLPWGERPFGPRYTVGQKDPEQAPSRNPVTASRIGVKRGIRVSDRPYTTPPRAVTDSLPDPKAAS